MNHGSILQQLHCRGRPASREPPQPVYNSRYGGLQLRLALVRENSFHETIIINSADKVYNLVKEELISSDREVMLSILLTSSLRLIGVETVAIGNRNSCGTYPAELFKSAILANASFLILCHNHPSGDPEPSRADITFTETIVRAGELLGIRVNDHVIVTAHGYRSLKALDLPAL